MDNAPVNTPNIARDTAPLLFYKVGNAFSPELLTHIKDITHRDIEEYDEWCSLVVRLSSPTGLCPGLIVLGLPAFAENNATLHELTNTISTLCRCRCASCETKCSVLCSQVKLAVSVEAKSDVSLLKELQHSVLSGIIPVDPAIAPRETLYAITEILSNRSHWSKSVINLVSAAEQPPKSPRSDVVRLTPRQVQVHSLLCDRGLSNKRIATALGITESTVKIHVSCILKAYGVRTRTQLVLAPR